MLRLFFVAAGKVNIFESVQFLFKLKSFDLEIKTLHPDEYVERSIVYFWGASVAQLLRVVPPITEKT